MSHSTDFSNSNESINIKRELLDENNSNCDNLVNEVDDIDENDFDDDNRLNKDYFMVPVVQTLTVLSDGENRSQNETSLVSIIKSENNGDDSLNDDSFYLPEEINDLNAARKKVGRPVTSPRTMAQNFPSITVIEKKLETGECYCRTRASNSSSEVWSIFEEIAYASDNKFTNIVRCKLCFFMTRYHGQITGTSHMRRHSCFTSSFPVASCKTNEEERLDNSSKNKRKSLPSTNNHIITVTTTNNQSQSCSTNPSSNRRNKPDLLPTIAQVYNLDKFTELRDAISLDLLNHGCCKVCRAIVKMDAQSLNGHLCKQKDIEKMSSNQAPLLSVLFRSKPQNRATPIWEDFEEVVDPTTHALLSYVRCKKCQEIFRASDPKSIPSVLRRHQARCPFVTIMNPITVMTTSSHITPKSMKAELEKKSNITTIALPINSNTIKTYSSTPPPMPITSAIIPPSTTITPLPSAINVTPKMINAKKDFRERVLKFAVNELVSLESLTSENFRKLAQSLMSLGAQCGRSTLVLPETNQLYNQMHSHYLLIRSQLKNEINNELSSSIGAALVCDSHDDLCIITCYYINSNWQLIESIIGATTTGSDINSFITSTLTDYGLNEEEKLSKMTFVSRGGLFDGVNICLFSVSHTIDTIIESTLFSDDTFTEVIENCRLICNQLNINIKLDEIVSKVDWLQKFELFHLVYINQDKFELKNSSLDIELVTYIVTLLSPFKDASVELRNCSKHSTLNHVLLWYHKLMKVLTITQEEMKTEQTFRRSLKSSLKSAMEQNFNLHVLHKIAAFLWPNFRYLKMLTPEERLEVHTEVRNFIDARVGRSDDNISSAKKARSDFSDWEDITDLEQDEVDKYVSAMLTSCNEINILHWWKEHQTDFPKLAHLAKWILSIPASVTLLEKFKLTSTQTIDNELLFMHCNSSNLRKERFSAIVKSKALHPSLEKREELRNERKLLKEMKNKTLEEKRLQIEEKKRRRDENRRRKEENARKSEIIQKIKNVSKLKNMSKKNLRKIRKISKIDN